MRSAGASDKQYATTSTRPSSNAGSALKSPHPRQFPQRLCRPVHILRRRKWPHTEAGRPAAGQGADQAVEQRRAVDAAAGEDAVAAFQGGGELLRGEALEAEADDADAAGRVARAVAREAGNRLNRS